MEKDYKWKNKPEEIKFNEDTGFYDFTRNFTRKLYFEVIDQEEEYIVNRIKEWAEENQIDSYRYITKQKLLEYFQKAKELDEIYDLLKEQGYNFNGHLKDEIKKILALKKTIKELIK